jgi:hypothetical protein
MSITEVFGPEWVRKRLVPKEAHAKPPDSAGCDLIVAEIKKAFAREMLKNEQLKNASYAVHPSQSHPRFAEYRARGLHISWPKGWSHGDTAFQKQRRWHDHVVSLAEVMRAELGRVNPYAVDIGYSKDGPIVRTLVDAIPIITGEHPSPAAIAKKLERS